MIYDLAPMKPSTFRKFQTDDPRSRYQAQLGVGTGSSWSLVALLQDLLLFEYGQAGTGQPVSA